MAVTTLRSIVDAWEALVVEGVIRRHPHGPPESLNTEDLPCQFVRTPTANGGAIVFGEQGSWPEWGLELVILVEAVGQRTNTENFDACIDMFDSLLTALFALPNCYGWASKTTWSIRMGPETCAGVDCWAVIATLGGRG